MTCWYRTLIDTFAQFTENGTNPEYLSHVCVESYTIDRHLLLLLGPRRNFASLLHIARVKSSTCKMHMSYLTTIEKEFECGVVTNRYQSQIVKF